MKERKKDKNIRRAGIVTALVVVTLSLVGGTLAKYTGTATHDASAPVAKFEVGSSFTEDVFNLNSLYDDWKEKPVILGNVLQTPTAVNTAGDHSEQDVWSNNTDKNILAPGTSGFFEIGLENNSEVAVRASNITLSETNTNSIPIEYSLITYNASGQPDTSSDWGTIAALNTAISTASGLGTYDLMKPASGTSTTKTVAVAWRWLFEREPVATNDSLDTNLGTKNATNENEVITGDNDYDKLSKYQLKVDVAFTQLD